MTTVLTHPSNPARPPLRTCSLCGDSECMKLLYDFGHVPVAGYLESTREVALEAPRFHLGIAICRKTGLVQQAYVEGREVLIKKVYANYQPTYSMSERVVSYMGSFLDRSMQGAGVMPKDRVLEIGSNDGHVLRLLRNRGLHPIGFEPSSSLAAASRDAGLEVVQDYFGLESARRFIGAHVPAKLLITRHTLEHAFDPLDFLRGIEVVLAHDGLAVIEVPYVRLQMMNGHFEAMTFQHVSFFSVASMVEALTRAGLSAVDVSFVSMDGGSMVIFARKTRRCPGARAVTIDAALELESLYALNTCEAYHSYFRRMDCLRANVKSYLNRLAQKGQRILGYGAGGKGQALLGILELGSTEIALVIDDVPGNAGKFIPGTGIEIVSSRDSRAQMVDVMLLTAPTHIQEIVHKEAWRLAHGTRFMATVPDFHQPMLSTL